MYEVSCVVCLHCFAPFEKCFHLAKMTRKQIGIHTINQQGTIFKTYSINIQITFSQEAYSPFMYQNHYRDLLLNWPKRYIEIVAKSTTLRDIGR